jgi:hypothetical protein
MERDEPRKVVVKIMTSSASVERVYSFFEDVKKSMEAGGSAKSVAEGANGWWTFDHVTAGRASMRHRIIREAGVIDHTFAGAGLEWTVYVRVVPNRSGATTTWTFVRPDGLTDEQFEGQLKSFDGEIALWKQALES